MLRERRRDFGYRGEDCLMCQHCLHNPCVPGCPNYKEPKAAYYCSICGQGIYAGDEYVDNGGDYIHFECVPDLHWLLKWLGYEVKEMKDIECYKE